MKKGKDSGRIKLVRCQLLSAKLELLLQQMPAKSMMGHLSYVELLIFSACFWRKGQKVGSQSFGKNNQLCRCL